MKGIILAGGHGTRLLPLTSIISKQLLPIYDRPMIFYPLNTLVSAGIREILIIVAPQHSGHYLNLLGSLLSSSGIQISFMVQRVPRGLSEAFILGADFLDGEPGTLILGDNIFEDDFQEAIQSFETGGRIFAKEVANPERFGVVEFDASQRVLSIEEKPSTPKSRYAIPGIYIFDGEASTIAASLAPSPRGELEITDMHNAYLKRGVLDVRTITGAWFDAGTHDSLLETSRYVKEHGLHEKFDPLITEALRKYNTECKRLVTSH